MLFVIRNKTRTPLENLEPVVTEDIRKVEKKLPKQCIKEIDSLCAAFLWSGPVLNTQKARVAWKDCCKPKDEDGLGLTSISEANNVSCLKLVWRILSAADSLWVRWITRYLIRKRFFLVG